MLSYLDSAQAAVPKVLSRSCWCSLYKLELLRKSLGGKMIFNGEDGLFNFCYLGECDCIVQATNVWYLYKDTQGSMSKSIHLKRREVDLDTVRDLDVAGRFENARRAFECHLALEAAELMYLSGEYGPVPAARFLGEQAAKGGCFERLDASEFSLDPRRRVVYGLCRDGRFRHALRASQVIRMLQGIRANIKGTIRPGRRP